EAQKTDADLTEDEAKQKQAESAQSTTAESEASTPAGPSQAEAPTDATGATPAAEDPLLNEKPDPPAGMDEQARTEINNVADPEGAAAKKREEEDAAASQ